jgi:hypothetical protein
LFRNQLQFESLGYDRTGFLRFFFAALKSCLILKMPREKSSPAHPKTRLSNGSAMTFFTTRDIDQGTGLGLSVVHGIITPHGGSLHLAKR